MIRSGYKKCIRRENKKSLKIEIARVHFFIFERMKDTVTTKEYLIRQVVMIWVSSDVIFGYTHISQL